MVHAEVGDTVRVAMPKGLSKRGVPGISVMYSTWPEARFEGAEGHVVEVKPRGTHGVPLFLVDFRGHDNGRIALPWQSQWFREDWIAVERLGGGGGRRSPETAMADARRDAGARDGAGAEAQPVGGRTTVLEESQADPVARDQPAGSIDKAVPTASGVAAPDATPSSETQRAAKRGSRRNRSPGM